MPASSRTTTINIVNALPSLCAALKAVPGVREVMVQQSDDQALHYLFVDPGGRSVLAAALYTSVPVVVPLAARSRRSLNNAVCGVAAVHGLSILHGVQARAGRHGQYPLDRTLPHGPTLSHERHLTAARLDQEGALARRQMAEATGMTVPTGVALLTGAPLNVETLEYPLADAEWEEYKRMVALLKLPDELQMRLKMAEMDQAHARNAQDEQQVGVWTARIAQLRADLQALDTPEAEAERREARFRLYGWLP